MPSPFTWDTTKPAGGDALSIGDDQIRTDKTTLLALLRALVPFGAPTTGPRIVQVNNAIYIVHNASTADGTTWSHDDTAVDAVGIRISSGALEVIFRPATASTWTTWVVTAQFASASGHDNYLRLESSTATPILQAQGADANINILLDAKGTGVTLGALFSMGSSGGAVQLAADNTTRYVAPSGISAISTTEADHRIGMGAAVIVRQAYGRLNDAAPGAGKSRTFTLMKNGLATAITFTISDASSSGNITGQSVSFSAGDFMSWECTAAGTPAASRIELGIGLETA